MESRRYEGSEEHCTASRSHICSAPDPVTQIVISPLLPAGCALGPADRTFFVRHAFVLVGVVWLALCALSQKLCGLNVIWALNGFLLVDVRPGGGLCF